jgi:hypothetical protein
MFIKKNDSLNDGQFLGHVTAFPELKHTNSLKGQQF